MTDFTASSVTVRAPATSANLGPGFDSLALALDLADLVSAKVTAGGTEIVVTGEGAADLRRDDSNLVASTMRTLFARWGLAQPGLRLSCRNSIPQGMGLGSSAAAITAGLRLAQALVPEAPLSAGESLALACELEGHPDNVAACLLGGLTISWQDDGVASAITLEVAGSVTPVVLLAATALPTSLARGLLPPTVTHRDASTNSGRAALLIAALTARPELLLAATVDHLHQDARRAAMKESMALVDKMRAAGLAAVISGAGPSVLALCTTPQVRHARGLAPAGWRVLPLSVERLGARILPA